LNPAAISGEALAIGIVSTSSVRNARGSALPCDDEAARRQDAGAMRRSRAGAQVATRLVHHADIDAIRFVSGESHHVVIYSGRARSRREANRRASARGWRDTGIAASTR
jgi:hypothetical protein